MKMNWFMYSIIAMLAFTVNFLLIKKLSLLGVKSQIVLMYVFAISALIVLSYSLMTKDSMGLSKYALLLIILTAVFAVVGNFFLFESIGGSPNPGYSLAVSGIHILLVTIASIFIFQSDFTLNKIIGTIFAVIGIILIGWK